MIPEIETTRLALDFAQRLAEVRARIASAAQAAGRSLDSITLLPVTKTHPASAVALAASHGLTAVGENRVQEASDKRSAFENPPDGQPKPAPVRWELIGHLQSNKAKAAVATFDRIQSVDTIKLARLLARASGEAARILPILLQVNSGNDPAKFGCEPEEAPALLEACLAEKSLRVDGLMCIAPLSEDPGVAARTFDNLRTQRDQLERQFGVRLTELSMGMSGDLDAAIRSGSTLLRVGTALFGGR
jgi:hypothetical protein